jgi:DNA-binding CsgD family transcriptional regulator
LTDEITPLSDRELEILQLVATGATNQQIAQELVISVNTVKVHLRNIYGKLGVASRTEATMVAVRQGWVGVSSPEGAALESDSEDSGRRAAAGHVPAQPGALPQSILPRLEPWPRISVAKRVSLVVAILLATAILIVPLVLQGQANGRNSDPISEVFPTAPAGPSSTRWHTRAQMPTPRTGLAVASHDGLIYAIGGVSNDGATAKVEIYDPELNVWTTGRSKPTPSGFVSGAVVDGKLFLPGGIGADQEVLDLLEIYDPETNTWDTAARLPEPLAAYGLAAVDGQLYLFGGLGEQGYVASVHRYDVAADRWEAMDPLEEARGFLGAVAVDGGIYVAGGYDDVKEFNRVDSYDPATNSWTPLPPMELARGGVALVAVRQQVYAIGGGMTGYLAFNERYDARIGSWNRVETPVREQWQSLGAAFVDPFIYGIGGWSEGNLSVNEAYQALFQSLVPLLP